MRQALQAAHGQAAAEIFDPCWHPPEVHVSDGYINGAVRASFGFASKFEDASALVRFIKVFAASHPEDYVHSAVTQQIRVHGCIEEAECTVSKKRSCRTTGTARRRAKKNLAVLKPAPCHSHPGEQDALPKCCGTLKQRRKAGKKYPSALAALTGESIPGVCWYLHDLRHRHSIEEEFPITVFGGLWQARTVLMLAASRGSAEMVSVLIGALRADVNHASSSDGDTALHRAACHGRPEVVKILLEAGADVKARVRGGALTGWTPSRVAEWKARGDRHAHSMAQHANYHPKRGGAFAEALEILELEERRVARSKVLTVIAMALLSTPLVAVWLAEVNIGGMVPNLPCGSTYWQGWVGVAARAQSAWDLLCP